jgi:hypothetical protein
MNITERSKLLSNIAAKRNSTIISYIGGDRQNVSIRVAPDIIPIFYKILEKLGPSPKIDLFLYTKGGDVLTALRLIQLIYEFTDNFSVIIPYKAYSAGTLITLGASEIIMTKMSELSPVDPNVTSAFNPAETNNRNIKLPINVEDVYSFITLAKDVVGLKTDEAMVQVFTNLTEHVHPLAVGSIYRTHALIRAIARELLLMHMNYTEEYKINEIVDTLIERLHSHSFMITRHEAKNIIKLPVTYCNEAFEKEIWQLYETYEKDLFLNEPFHPEAIADSNGNFSVCSGIIETPTESYGYIFDGIINNSNVDILNQGWRYLP